LTNLGCFIQSVCIWYGTNCSPMHEGAARPRRGQTRQCFCRDWAYRVVHQEGSHIVLETSVPAHQRMSVPNHKPLRIGTLNAILRAVARHKGVHRQDVRDSLH
jgi:hypothetical protein